MERNAGFLVNPIGEKLGTRKDHRFTYLELATVLVRAKGIHEGHWAVLFGFKTQAQNMDFEGEEGVFQGLMSCVAEIGIHRYDEPNPMTVDAAEVNPKGGIN